MKQLHTEIQINASAETIWNILLDFENYKEWNPFIKSIKGDSSVGSKLIAELLQPDSKPMTIKPKVTSNKPNEEFSWLGHLLIPGLFDGNHIFQLERIDDQTTRFVHKENFRGILISFLWKMLDTKTRKGFELMNEALKKRAEAI